MSGVHELLEIAKRGGYDAKLDMEKETVVFTPRKQTNADLYRLYSDEQIAELFNQIETEGKAYGPRGKKAWLDWLKQEASK